MPKPSIALGAVCTMLAMAVVAAMASIVKWASHGYSSEFLMVIRWVAGLFIFLTGYALGRRVELRTIQWRTQAGVAICWTTAILLFYMSVRYVPLMDATLLLNTSALFAPLLAWVIDGKRESKVVWAGSAIGFVGVLIVLRPGPEMFRPMALLGLAAGLMMAFRIFLASRLADEPKSRTTFYSLAVGLAVCVLIFSATGFQIARPSWEGMLFTPVQIAEPLFVDSVLVAAVIVFGVLSLLQPLFIAWSLQYTSVGHIAPFRYTAVVFAAAIDWLVWNQPPTWASVTGLLLIAAGATLSLVRLH